MDKRVNKVPKSYNPFLNLIPFLIAAYIAGSFNFAGVLPILIASMCCYFVYILLYDAGIVKGRFIIFKKEEKKKHV